MPNTEKEIEAEIKYLQQQKVFLEMIEQFGIVKGEGLRGQYKVGDIVSLNLSVIHTDLVNDYIMELIKLDLEE